MKFGRRFRNLLGIKCMKMFSNAFRFDIFIARCQGGSVFLPDTVYSFFSAHVDQSKCIS